MAPKTACTAVIPPRLDWSHPVINSKPNYWPSLKPKFPTATALSEISDTDFNWVQTSTHHFFSADLPGLNKENVAVEVVDDEILKIKVQTRLEKSREGWSSQSSSSFTKAFTLPSDAHVDNVSAQLHNGILTITVPRIPPHDLDDSDSDEHDEEEEEDEDADEEEEEFYQDDDEEDEDNYDYIFQ